MASTYSFLDTMASISGPNGAFSFGAGSGNTEGGISIVYTEDINTMTIGADGEGMHSLHAGKSGTITVRLLQTAPVNALLAAMFNLDRASGVSHGRNTITVRDLVQGDIITCQQCAFVKFTDVTYAKDQSERVWTFHSIKIDPILGSGDAVAAA